MELEIEDQGQSINIPLSDSNEFLELFVNELSDDTSQLISFLFGECVPLQYWIKIAVSKSAFVFIL